MDKSRRSKFNDVRRRAIVAGARSNAAATCVMLANASIQNTTTPQVLPLCAALDDFPAYVELRRVPTAGSPLSWG